MCYPSHTSNPYFPPARFPSQCLVSCPQDSLCSFLLVAQVIVLGIILSGILSEFFSEIRYLQIISEFSISEIISGKSFRNYFRDSSVNN